MPVVIRLAGPTRRMTTGTSPPTTGDDNSSCFSLDPCALAPTSQYADRIRRPAPVGGALRPRPWWRTASPRAVVRARASSAAAMSSRPEEQAPPSCKANVGSSSSTGRLKLVTFNDRNGSRLCKNSLEIPVSEVRRWRHCRFSLKLAEMENRKSPLRPGLPPSRPQRP